MRRNAATSRLPLGAGRLRVAHGKVAVRRRGRLLVLEELLLRGPLRGDLPHLLHFLYAPHRLYLHTAVKGDHAHDLVDVEYVDRVRLEREQLDEGLNHAQRTLHGGEPLLRLGERAPRNRP